MPLTLALAMLAVVVLAGLLPDAGVVSASSNCTYGKCPASSPFPVWAVSAAVVVVLLALIVALLLLRRGRRRPPAGQAPESTTAPEPNGGSEAGSDPNSSTQSWGDSPAGGSYADPAAPDQAPPEEGPAP